VATNPAVAVIDVGSNSIKVLVAAGDGAGHTGTLLGKTIDARIGAGLSQTPSRLSEEGMTAGLAAIQNLLAEATPFSPVRVLLVATSAVRDAVNGPEFAARVQRETGCELRILSGEDEANGIGRGLTCDPALAGLANFYVFDLGGGSLECLGFQDRDVQQAISLPLGCVRLTEKFIADPTAPIRAVTCNRIMAHTRTVMAESGFRFDLPESTAVATGGTASTVRTIYGLRTGRAPEGNSSLITVRQLREQLELLCPLTLEQRRKVPGLPPERADVFPAALATLIAVAETGGLNSYRHSFYNLRYGLATELLACL
jgi:exopolyphosphatase/guanosine-5'-triphosphate,3'-diphosphate pyrophosphatase